MKQHAGNILRALFWPRHAWSYASNAIRVSRDLNSRPCDLFSRVSAADTTPDDQPAFAHFRAGWRSGSTLLQRMIMRHNENIVMWGEPCHRCNIFDGLANQFRAFTFDWPNDSQFSASRDRQKGWQTFGLQICIPVLTIWLTFTVHS